MVLDTLSAVIAIVLIDLALSGDNALVIGIAARGLPPEQRRTAIILGGLVLVAIAYRLVSKQSDGAHDVREATTLREAILTIVIADAAMSLENVLGVGAAAHGDLPLLAF